MSDTGDTTIGDTGGSDTSLEPNEALEKLQEELKAKNEEVAKLTEQVEQMSDKDKNFAQLRKQKTEAEEKAKALEAEMDDKINTLKNEIFEGVHKDHYNDVLKSLAGDDKELREKVEANYHRLSDDAGTKDEISKKLMDAYRLSVETPEQDVLNTAVISSGGGVAPRAVSSKGFSAEEKELAHKLAKAGGMTLEDDDFKV